MFPLNIFKSKRSAYIPYVPQAKQIISSLLTRTPAFTSRIKVVFSKYAVFLDGNWIGLAYKLVKGFILGAHYTLELAAGALTCGVKIAVTL